MYSKNFMPVQAFKILNHLKNLRGLIGSVFVCVFFP